tara:strand:- start:207 stop:578 length:372 start_codon:yes stop_codon:yes gene_type:complete
MNKFKPYQISAINAVSLIALGFYGYIQSDSPSMTALIPVIFGVLLLLMNSGIKSENKLIAHIAVTLTLVILFGLAMPLLGAIGRSDTYAILRVSVMVITTVISMVFFVKSFIEARKNKEASQT